MLKKVSAFSSDFFSLRPVGRDCKISSRPSESCWKMSSERKYKNSPIGEAVCELRIIPGSPWDLAVPGLVYERLKKTFPKRRQVKTVGATLTGGAVTTVEVERLQFMQEDEKALVVIGKDVLAVSRLNPYPGWETYRPMILDAFTAYKEITNPTSFQRLGLRYVNQVNFKEDRIQLEDFFEFYPFVGKLLPQDHGTFIVGIELPFTGGRDNLRLQLATNPAAPGSKLSLTLDLDYFLMDPTNVGLSDLEKWLEQAHSALAETFEGCLKDSLRKRFQEMD